MAHKKKATARKKRLNPLLKTDVKEVFGEQDIKTVLSRHISDGLTTKDIANKYEFTPDSVREWLRRLGLTSKNRRSSVTDRLNRLGYATWDEFFRRNMTMTHAEAAEMLNCHWTSVSRYHRLWRDGKKV